MVLEIRIPCSRCDAPIRFGADSCPECRARVSREAQEALEDRLEAASADFREMKTRIVGARAVLFILAGVHTLVGAIVFVASMNSDLPETDETAAATVAIVVSNLGLAVVLGACAAWARRRALTALLVATALWMGVQVLVVVANPLSILSVGTNIAKAAAIIMLLWGVKAAVQADGLRKRLSAI